MGITIHWDLEFDGTHDEARAVLERIRGKMMDLPFEECGEVAYVDPETCGKVEKLMKKRQAENDRDKAKVFEKQIQKLLDGGADADPFWAFIQADFGIFDKNDGQAYHGYHRFEPNEYFLLPLWAMEGCEATNLILAKHKIPNLPDKWRGKGFTKTVYSKNPVLAHILVVKALKACLGENILTRISDEADYWMDLDNPPEETEEQIQALAAEFTTDRKMMNSHVASLKMALDKINAGGGVEAAIDRVDNLSVPPEI